MRPLIILALAVVPLLLTSCRDFQVPPEYHGPVPMGVGCTESAECVTDLCADGVCCERACAEDELCDVEGREGRCTPRPPGTPCARAAQCPGGRCLHTATSSYCFEDGCAADERYDIPGHEGTCTPRPPGHPCDGAEQCPGGRCFHPAGGGAAFCCDRDCATDESCEVPGHEGTCTERPPGTPCSEPQQCPTGLCVAGQGGASLCCEKACAAAERCDAPGHEGACTPRALGDACQAGADCPLGHCVQGVCCESACEDDCKSCAREGSRGQCKDVEENTDPRGRCGFCGACTRGFCGAALANTAPKDDCGKGTGKVCSASQTCGLETGSPCAQDADCAAGVCALARCLLAETSFVYPQPLEPQASEVGLVGLAVDSSGLLGVGVASIHEYQTSSGLIPDYNQYTTMVHGAADWERALHVKQDCDQGCSRMAGDLTFWGGRLYQVQYQPCTTGTACGLVGQLFGSELQAGGREQIGPADAFVTSAFVSVDGSQRLWAAFADHTPSTGLVRVARRQAREGAPPEWAELWSTPDPSWSVRAQWGAAVVGDEVYVVTLVDDPVQGPSFAVMKDPGVVASQRALPGECSTNSFLTGLAVGSFGRGADQGISMAANCVDGTYAATWTPAAPEPWWLSADLASEPAALPVRNADVPAFVVFRAGRVSDLALWWKGPAGDWGFGETPAFSSSIGAAAATAQAIADGDGAPVLAVTLFEYFKGPNTPPTKVQVVRYHR